MAPLERNRNIKSIDNRGQRLGRTPYERTGTRLNTVLNEVETTNGTVGTTAQTGNASQPASRLSTLSRSVKRAFGSLWSSDKSEKESSSLKVELPANPLLLRQVGTKPIDTFSTTATVGSSLPQSQDCTALHDSSQDEVTNPSLVFGNHSTLPQFDLSLLHNQQSLSVPANMIIAAYRAALLANDTSTLKRKRFAPSPTPEPPKTPIDKSVAAAAQKSNNSSPVQAPVVEQGSTNAAITEPPIKTPKVDITADVTTKLPETQSRIELVTRPVVDLSKLPEDRKKRPGFISVNFDLSDSEEDDPEENEVPRRPLIESADVVEARNQAKKTETVSTEKPVFSFEPKKPMNDPKPTFSFGHTEQSKPAAAETSKPFIFGSDSKPSTGLNLSSDPNKQGVSTSTFSFAAKSDAKSEKPTFSFEKSDKTEAKNEKPAFSFGTASQSGSIDTKPAFNFHNLKAVEPETSTATKPTPTTEKSVMPALSFGDSKSDSPALNFGSTIDKPAEKSETKSAFNFDLSKDNGPTFSFGSKNPAASITSSNKDQQVKPSFSFGDQKSQDKPPAFNVGETPKVQEKPTVTVGAVADNENKSGFSFSGGVTKQGTPASAFSFGDNASNHQDKPVFTFGSNASKPQDKPVFTLDSNTSNPQDKPTFSFGGSVSKPQDNSASSTEASSKDKPVFTFGDAKDSQEITTVSAARKPADAPPFSFGATKPTQTLPEKPVLNFGAQPAGTMNDKQFNFGSEAAKPAFSFTTKSEESKSASDKPFTFGSQVNNDKPAFSFGTQSSTPAAAPSSEQPAPTNNFSFGASSTPTTTSSTPAPFSFGQNNNKPNASFAFGSNGATPPPASNGGGNGFSFASNANVTHQATPTVGLSFGANNDSKPAGSGFSFGTNPRGPANASFGFGANTPAAPAAGGAGFSFGANAAPSHPQGFSFGSGTVPAPQFGANNNFANNPLASGLAQAPVNRANGRPIAPIRRRIPPRR